MSEQSVSGGVPTYCPHPSCSWSFAGSRQRGTGYLETHLRVVHKNAEVTAKSSGSKTAPIQPLNGSTTPKQVEELNGFKPGGPEKIWTDDAIIQALQKWSGDHDDVPPTAEQWRYATPDTPNLSVVQRAFGSWTAALETAGLESRGRGHQSLGKGPEGETWSRVKVTKEAAVEALREGLTALGGRPTSLEWSASKRRPSVQTFLRIFGSWDAALAAVSEPEGNAANPNDPAPATPSEALIESTSSPQASTDVEVTDEVTDEDADEAERLADLADTQQASRSFAETAAELEAAYEAMSAASDRFVAASNAFSRHPTTLAICADQGRDWLEPDWGDP